MMMRVGAWFGSITQNFGLASTPSVGTILENDFPGVMIQVEIGEFKLDDYQLVIHPALSLTTFRASDIPIIQKWDENEDSGIYLFRGSIDGMVSSFWITFLLNKLYYLRFREDITLYDQKVIDRELRVASEIGHEAYVAELNKWTEITRQVTIKQRDKHDAWLRKATGSPPPYEYDWGEIKSEINPSEEYVKIWVRFKYSFGENINLKTYFENRREQEHRHAMNPPKPMVPGQLPPGFSWKV